MVIETVGAAILVMLVSLVGAISTWRTLGNWMTKNLHYLISFSAGVFLIVALGLVREVFGETTLLNTVVLVGFGMLLFFVFDRVVLGTHEHHDPSSAEHVHSKAEGHRVMMADALHNITDGIILVPAFAVSIELGVVVTVGIVVHELVQEISEFFVLRDAGYTTSQALVRNALVSSTILIGVALGFLLTQIQIVELGLLGLAAGGFFYVVFLDLLPHSLKVCRGKYCQFYHIGWALVGVLVMFGVSMITGDTHGHGDVNGDTHKEEVFDKHSLERAILANE